MPELNKNDYHIILCSETPDKDELMRLMMQKTDKPILIVIDNDKEERTLEEVLKEYREPMTKIPIVPLPEMTMPYVDDTKQGWNTKPSYANIKHKRKRK